MIRFAPFLLAAQAAPAAAPADLAPALASDDRDDHGFDPARLYRDAPDAPARLLAPTDRVYRSRGGAYYCKRPDGSTGRITGAIDGDALGDAVLPGHSRTAATLIRDYVASLAGQAWYRPNHEIRCR